MFHRSGYRRDRRCGPRGDRVGSPHGMQANNLDLNSMLFCRSCCSAGTAVALRWPRVTFAGPVPPPRTDYRRHWREELWDLVTPYGRTVLESPLVQAGRDPLDWLPGHWYRPRSGRRMRAFALPGYSDGLIRISVVGRDGEVT